MVRFDGGTMTSDAGALLLRSTDRRLNLLPRLAACFDDQRDSHYVLHSVPELLAQRVYGLAWPEVEIILRADSGFCREELMAWCEQQGI
jgi:hypothetical protein